MPLPALLPPSAGFGERIDHTNVEITAPSSEAYATQMEALPVFQAVMQPFMVPA
ncbi:hypothetical protein [Mesorhizobium sp. M1409]|uniref:hypothetical protein n=1 Tax=unclassified Mesorhizobium TaxID=325217 RepID=UPI003335C4EE